MKSKLLVLTTFVLLSYTMPAIAREGMSHDETMNVTSTTEPQGETVATSKAIEVGNKICPVTGNKVDDGKMGKIVQYEYDGKIYNLCCPMCVKDFKKDPEKYRKIVEKNERLEHSQSSIQEESHSHHH